MPVRDDPLLDYPHTDTSNFMRLVPAFVALLFSACSVFGGSQQTCRILDPDLAQGIYHGGCKDGLADGYGEVDALGKAGDILSSYHGDFLAGKKNGKGSKLMPNGDRYTGDFRDDYREGKGSYVWGPKSPWAGDRYEGEYHHDLRDGWGIYQWASGDRYEGTWQEDLRMGPSVMELRRAQAAEAVAKSIKVGASVCSEDRSNKGKGQRIRGIVESVNDKTVQVQIFEVKGGMTDSQDASLKKGGLLVDEIANWQLCDQD